MSNFKRLQFSIKFQTIRESTKTLMVSAWGNAIKSSSIYTLSLLYNTFYSCDNHVPLHFFYTSWKHKVTHADHWLVIFLQLRELVDLIVLWPFLQERHAGLGGSVGCAVRLETRRSRVQPPPRSATFFRGDWSWNIFYGHSLPSADSRRAVVSFWRKNVHNTG